MGQERLTAKRNFMGKLQLHELEGVSETLLSPLHYRVLESRNQASAFKDEIAERFHDAIDHDWGHIRGQIAFEAAGRRPHTSHISHPQHLMVLSGILDCMQGTTTKLSQPKASPTSSRGRCARLMRESRLIRSLAQRELGPLFESQLPATEIDAREIVRRCLEFGKKKMLP
jgi:hypothetical protein